MWRNIALAYDCMPSSAAFMVQAIWTVDAAKNYRINAITYGILEGGTWTPAEQNWRDWFRQNFELTFILQNPPENSYFTLGRPLWDYLYTELDNGHAPNYDLCYLLRFPASQGGAWPVRWPTP